MERAELAVLKGVLKSDWPKIRQLVLEVHDYGGRLTEVKTLLSDAAGFHLIAIEQDTRLKGSTLYNLYATRR